MHLNATPISALYILSGVVGFAVSVQAIPRYHFSLHAARRVEHPDDRADAVRINMGVVAREWVRLSIHILGVIVGVASLWIVPASRPPPSLFDRWFGLGIVAVLLWANVGTTINTILAWMEYRTARRRDVPPGVSIIADLRRRIRRVERGRDDP